MSMLTDDDLQQAKAWLHAKAEAFALRVAPCYAVLQWRWAMPSEDAKVVPDSDEVLRFLQRLIARLTAENPSSDSGGLRIWIEKDDREGKVYCGMSFVVDDENCGEF